LWGAGLNLEGSGSSGSGGFGLRVGSAGSKFGRSNGFRGGWGLRWFGTVCNAMGYGWATVGIENNQLLIGHGQSCWVMQAKTALNLDRVIWICLRVSSR